MNDLNSGSAAYLRQTASERRIQELEAENRLIREDLTELNEKFENLQNWLSEQFETDARGRFEINRKIDLGLISVGVYNENEVLLNPGQTIKSEMKEYNITDLRNQKAVNSAQRIEVLLEILPNQPIRGQFIFMTMSEIASFFDMPSPSSAHNLAKQAAKHYPTHFKIGTKERSTEKILKWIFKPKNDEQYQEACKRL